MGRRFRPGALFLELPNFSDVQHWWPDAISQRKPVQLNTQ